MLATHRVKDTAGNTVGFIVDKVFYTDYRVRADIGYIDNLTLLKNNTIRAKRELPEVKYIDVVTRNRYKELVDENPFKRDIENSLISWKRDGAKKILQVDGARQIGKTTEILKFAYKNYEYIIYVNLSDDQFDFASCISTGATPLDFEKYCRKANLPHFSNSDRTILIIDEVQENKDIFNALRRIQGNLNCHIIITGSYLGRYAGYINNKSNNAFFSMGNVEPIKMFSMSFREFCRVFSAEKALMQINIYGKSAVKSYQKLDSLYNLYCTIGGYPSVVKRYIETRDISKCYKEIELLITVFKQESSKYFTQPKQVEVFNKVFEQAIVEMTQEKRGTGKDILTDLTDCVKSGSKLLVARDEISNAIAWLINCSLIATCSMIQKKDFANMQPNRRLYFLDCGIASYLLSNSVISESSQRGILAETFTFCELNRLYYVEINSRKVKSNLCFSVYNNYELDFVVVGKGKEIENLVFGIEVKAKTGGHQSLNVYLDNKFIDKGILAKYTKGGQVNRFDTIPIYTVGARFPYK